VWFTLRTSHARPVVRLIAYVVLCLAAVVAAVSFFMHAPGNERGGIFAVCCLLYLIAPFSIVRHIVVRREVDQETLLGAVAAYLLIGMFFAFAYKAAGEFGSVPFFGSDGAGTLSQDLFFSFVTMTTVGYGNLVPAANSSRACCPRGPRSSRSKTCQKRSTGISTSSWCSRRSYTPAFAMITELRLKSAIPEPGMAKPMTSSRIAVIASSEAISNAAA